MMTGFPIAHEGMRIGLLGGSFDPPHAGHVNITQAAFRRFRLDRVWWLVSPGNPLKTRGPAPLGQRMQAAQTLVQDPRVVISDLEARMNTRISADTIAAMRRRWPGVRFIWLMGSDNLVQFHLWERWQEVAAAVPIGVLARPGTRTAARHSVAAKKLQRWRLPLTAAAGLADRRPPAWVLVNLPMSAHSSTALRLVRPDLRDPP